MEKKKTSKTFPIIVFDDENISPVHFSCEENSKSRKKINALLVQPGMHPRRITLNDDHKSLEAVVAKHLEYITPFRDSVAIFCNALGKIDGSKPNRGLYVGGKLVDVLMGNFIVVGDDINSEDISSLTPEQLDKYEKIFYDPI